MARAIGVDIGDHTIKVVELSGSARSFKVQRVAIRPVPGDIKPDEIEIADEEDDEAPPPPSREERISEVLKEIFRELALPKEDTCSSFHARNSMIREINVPFFDDDQIRKVVRFEAENHLHSQAIDDVVVNWVKTGETKDGSRLTIFASPKDRLASSIATMRRAGIDPAAVDLDATALYTTLDATGLIAAHPTCVVLHVGASSTNLILVVEGRPRVFRAFPLGTGALESALAHQLGAGHGHRRGADAHKDDLFVAAGDLPAAPGTPEASKSLAQVETDVVSEEREAFVNKLHREVIRSLAAVRTETPPERLLLTGGGALLDGVDEALAARFGLPVERLDLLDHVDAKDRGSDPEYAGAALGPAIGCALRMLGRNPLGIELLRDEFAPRNTFDVVRTALATLLTLGFLLMAALTLSNKKELEAEQAEFGGRHAIAKFIFREAEGDYLQQVEAETEEGARIRVDRWLKSTADDPKSITRMFTQMGRRLDYLRDQMGLSEKIPPLPSALEAMAAFYAALQTVDRAELGNFRIERMSIRTRQLQATILAESTSGHERARAALEASPYFQRRAKNPRAIVELGSSTTEGDMRKQEYTISFGDEE